MIIEIFAFSVVLAWMADLFLGDPSWLPHPIVLFGKVISRVEHLFNRGSNLMLKGLVSALGLILICFFLFFFAEKIIVDYFLLGWPIFVVVFVFFGLANRTLIDEGSAVFSVLRQHGVEAGRRQLSRIVGRDTSSLTPNQIRTAVLETMSENLSDGVVAPLFWLAVGGVPAMMAYKMVNTLDSMWGYRNERFNLFGRAAARIDDVANYIPARITGLLIAVIGGSWRSIRFMWRYGNSHKSPNSGFPESALAGVLNCRFGGSALYHGVVTEKPFIGSNERDIVESDIATTVFINHRVCIITLVLSIVGRYLMMLLL